MKKLLFLLLLFALFLPLPMSADENLCPQFSQHSAGEGFVDYESHEYINGFLSMHFKLAPNSNHKLGTAYKLLRSSDCQEAAPGGWWSMGTFDIPQDVNNFSIRFYQRINFGEYKYRVYNDDTNQVIDCPSCDYGIFNIVYFGGEPPHKFWLTLYTPYDFGYIPNLSVLPPTRFIASAQDMQQPEYTGKTPVLIVPGIMGTELWKDDDLIWPELLNEQQDPNNLILFDKLDLDENGNSLNNILIKDVIRKIPLSILRDIDIFDLLNDRLEKQASYALNNSLFYFPYDWRLDLNLTKDLLKQKIDSIKLQTRAPKVDIIAHSMGGLLTKAYIDSYGAQNINKLIFVGTPHLGAPKAGKVILEGDRFKIPWLDPDRVREIALNSPALHELLPSPAYFSQYQGYIKSFNIFADLPPFYNYQATKDFYINQKNKNPLMFQKAQSFFDKKLENMDFSGVDTYNIAGCKNSTQTGYQVNASGNISRVGYSSGDETVPLISADYVNIPALHKYYVKNGSHSQLPSTNGVRELILDILNGVAPTLKSNISGFSNFCNFKGKTLSWHSPVEVHIYSGGLHTGPIENNGIEYGIPGVDYDIIGGEKFIFLPTDEGQIYSVQAHGEALGKFDLHISNNDNGEVLDTYVFNDVPISTGTLITFPVSETSEDNTISVDNQDVRSSSHLDKEQVEDLTPPITTAAPTGTPGNLGWFKGDVYVPLSAIDDLSGMLKTQYNLDSTAYTDYTGPISVTEEGSHTLEYYSVDNAGNNEPTKSLTINIDSTPPEFSLSFNLSIGDFEFRAIDNLDPNPSLECGFKQCTAQDHAGNTNKIEFQKLKVFNLQTLQLKKVIQNDESRSFPENAFAVNNAQTFNKLKDFNQTLLIKNREIASINYVKKRNISNIVELKIPKPKVYSLPGIHYLEIQTNKNNLNTNIK